jgi:hypothetical protein
MLCATTTCVAALYMEAGKRPCPCRVGRSGAIGAAGSELGSLGGGQSSSSPSDSAAVSCPAAGLSCAGAVPGGSSLSRILCDFSLDDSPNRRRNRARMVRCERRIAVTATSVFTRRWNRSKSEGLSCARTRPRAASTSAMSTLATSDLPAFAACFFVAGSISLLRSSRCKCQRFLRAPSCEGRTRCRSCVVPQAVDASATGRH